MIRLPLLEGKPDSLMAIILIVCLVLMIFNSNGVAVYGFGVEGEGYEDIDSGSLRGGP